MLLAPVLAVVLALLLAGAISQLLPQGQEIQSNSTPAPTWPPAPQPQAAASAADLFFLPALIICVFAIVIVAIAVGLLFFREKNLKVD